MPLIYKQGLNVSRINDLEKELGVGLPSDYREFLHNMNGWYLSAPDYLQLPLADVDGGEISFDRFFGPTPEDECNDLLSFNREFIAELDFLANPIGIGEDGGGNPFVLVCDGTLGGVYYWDRTHLHEFSAVNNFDIKEQGDSGNLFMVSTTFSEFQKRLSQLLGEIDIVKE
jgi:hypothetical protein